MRRLMTACETDLRGTMVTIFWRILNLDNGSCITKVLLWLCRPGAGNQVDWCLASEWA